ncbi:MAG: SBBP repeat-containing protein [Anaerolineae bacterium]|nr:SBBP repeat-containing protein [Anaerolineae bacterium]
MTKISPDGSRLIYSTYLGGSSSEYAASIAVDNAGNAYVTGFTESTDFPLTSNAFQTDFAAKIFVTKLNPTGDTLLYSTRLGGSITEESNDIAVDNAGNVYITGDTQSRDFPTRNAAQTYSDRGEAFVTRLDTNMSGDASLIYSTYIGGAVGGITIPNDTGRSIAVDESGNAYITGDTYASDFPTTASAYDNTLGGERDAFVVRLDTNAIGSASLIYSTLFGGTTGSLGDVMMGVEFGYGIAADNNGNVYITGSTYATDFPVTAGAFDITFNGPANDDDAYIAKFDTNASGVASLVYSTFLGSSGPDDTRGIALSKNGVYVVGFTYANDFPTVDPAQAHVPNSEDAFLTELNGDGSGLIYSTYFGGNSSDMGLAVAVDPGDNVYFAGRTQSSNFPTTNGAFDRTLNSVIDSYVVKMGTPFNAAPPRNYFTTPTPTLTWNPVSRVAQYIIQVSKTSTFTNPVYSATVPATQLEVTTDALTEGPYFWRVSANGGVTWSAVGSFTIDLPES